MNKAFLLFIITILSASFAHAQSGIVGQDSARRVITTAVPFLRISPDARSGAMGDIGVATSPDANSAYWNPGKVVFAENEMAAAISYTPWLAKIVDDMFLAHLSGYKKLSREQAIAVSLTYFDLGDLTLTDNVGNITAERDPREFAMAFTYSRQLSEMFGLGLTAKYIRSNLLGSFVSSEGDFNPANSVAVDLGVYFAKDLLLSGANSKLSAGLTMSNIGRKITYTSDGNESFIPGNLKLGTAFRTDLDPYNTITLGLDFNKLLVPTLAEDNDKSLLSGTFSSFGDAPGGGSEELKEITISSGLEYWYRELFSARAGYFYEHEEKGNRKYFTVGVGLRYQVFGIDFAYLIPTSQNHPLADTLRFTLVWNIEDGDSDDSVNDRQN